MTRRPGARVRRFPSSKILNTVLLVLSVLMLLATMGLGSLLIQQTRTLESSVALTQEAVDANVRTLSQVQRELLRLKVLLVSAPLGRAAIGLAESFVDQRVQEGALTYQDETLDSAKLLDRSRELAGQWTTAVRPALEAAVLSGRPTELSAAADRLTGLEKSYNQLVTDGEINRKVLAGQANDETRTLLSQARTLLICLTVTAAAFLVFLTVAGVSSRRSRRQREAAAAELLALNAELRTQAMVLQATDNLVVVTDRSGRVEWVNTAFVRSTGFTLADAKGRRPGDFLQGPDTDPATVDLMRAALEQGHGFLTEVFNYTATGRGYWLHVECYPVYDDSGVVTRFVAIETDVTERRLAEENLRSATETAVALAEEKSAFLATMSHEIRTPLNAVLGVTALLQGTALDDEQQEYVFTAQRSGSLLLALVNDILDFSALDSGRIDVETRAFDVVQMMDDVRSLFSTTAAAAGLELTTQIAADIPSGVIGDGNRIRQLLLNLVGNGLKFTHEGGVHIAVDALERPDLVLRFTVTDTGIGIAHDRQERIFLPFSQVDPSTTRKYGGTGLGLSICRLIAQHLGGRLELRSAPGKGSTFVFSVPVDRADAMGPTIPAGAAAEPPTPAADFSGLRVLLAEDDATNRMVALRMLQRLGVEADFAVDGEQAVDAVRDADYDLVLMDVNMPRMDGITATARIRALPDSGRAEPRIVAVTANALEGDSERLLAAGMDGYLSKPVTLTGLGSLLTAVVSGTTLPSGRS